MMRKLILFTSFFLLFTGIGYSQAKTKPVVKAPVSELKKLLTGSGLPFKLVHDSLAIIPFGGENIASYDVLVQKASDLYIIYTNLSEVLPGKLKDEKYKLLLQRNNDFDIIKTALDSESNTVYVRADVFRSGLTAALLTRIIKQVANVTNILAGDLK